MRTLTTRERILLEIYHSYYDYSSIDVMAFGYGLEANEMEKLINIAREVKNDYQEEYNEMFNLN